MSVVVFFRSEKRAKAIIIITVLKYLELPIAAVLNKKDDIFEIRICSLHPLNFFHFYLIYFYTHGISSPENTPCPGILAHLKRPLKNLSP